MLYLVDNKLFCISHLFEKWGNDILFEKDVRESKVSKELAEKNNLSCHCCDYRDNVKEE